MSSRGSAAVVVVPTASVGGSVDLAAGAVLAVGGAVMFCAEQLYRVYLAQQEKARQKGLAEQNRRIAESQKIRESQELAMRAAVLRFQANNPRLTMPGPAQQTALVEQVKQAQQTVQLRQASESELRQELDLMVARAELNSAIQAARALLPAEVLAKAAAAFSGGLLQPMWSSTAEINQTLRQMGDQRSVIALASQDARRYLRQASDDLTQAHTWLAVGPALDARPLDALAQQLGDMERQIDQNPSGARDQLKEYADKAQEFKNQMVSSYERAWRQLLLKATAQRGRLTALKDMAQDAGSNVTLPAEATERFKPIEDNLTTWMTNFGAFGASLRDGQRSLERISQQLDSATEELLEAISAQQQEVIANTIAETLGELGFVESHDAPDGPAIERVGNELHIVGARIEQQDQKLAAFFVDRDGGVSYDFSGYKGKECEKAAQEIFLAFRKKGLALVEADVARQLMDKPITADSLNPESYAPPRFEMNTRQALLRERVINALRRMGFQHVEEQIIGGTPILDAFNGDLGYHVSLPPDSSGQAPETLRRRSQMEAGVDISTDLSDQIVAEMQQEPARPASRSRKPWWSRSTQQATRVTEQTSIAGEM